MAPVFSTYGLGSGLQLSVISAVAIIIIFQFPRVQRYFVADQLYQHKSPADAMSFAFAPVTELLLISICVVSPVTFAVVSIVFAVDTDLNSQFVLLLYLVPIGAIKACTESLESEKDIFFKLVLIG